MHEPENEQAIDRRMAALFAAAGDPPDRDARFVAGVMKRVRRREQLRSLALGGFALLATLVAAPLFGVLEASLGGAEFGVIESIRSIADQMAASRSALIQSLEQYAVFLAAAALAAIAVPVLGLLED